jgi:hypothetical protein
MPIATALATRVTPRREATMLIAMGCQRSTTDARANTVALTAQGRSALEALRPKVVNADLRILDKIPAGKRDGFMKLLHALVETASTLDPTSPNAAKPKKLKAAKDKGEKKKKKKLKKALVGAAN